MTVVRRDYSMMQDRLTIIYDEIGGISFEKRLRELYKDESQYVYLKDERFDSRDLYLWLIEKRNRGEIILPQSRKIVYCHYLSLTQLTEKWVDCFFQEAEKMIENISYNSSSDQFHMIYFRVKSSSFHGDQDDEVAKMLIKLCTLNINIHRKIYLVWEQEPSESQVRKQEHAIVQMLHMCSRKGHLNLKPIGCQNNKKGLFALKYSDYSEEQYKEYLGELAVINHWLYDEEDPGLKKLTKALSKNSRPLIDELLSVERRFISNRDVFPVRTTDFSKGLFFRYCRDDSTVNKRLSSLFEEMLKKKATEIVNNTDFSDVYKVIDKYCLEDTKFLLNNYKSFKEEFLKQYKGNIKERMIIEAISERLEREVVSSFENVESKIEALDQEKIEKTQKKNQLINLLSQEGDYSNLNGCFRQINDNTMMRDFNGKQLSPTFTACLLHFSNTSNYSCNISGVSDAYIYPPISPAQVVMLKEYNYFDLNKYDDMNEDNQRRIQEDIKALFRKILSS